jgi:hypothetical protein
LPLLKDLLDKSIEHVNKKKIKEWIKKLLEIEINNLKFHIDRSIETLQKFNDVLMNIDDLSEPKKEAEKLAKEISDNINNNVYIQYLHYQDCISITKKSFKKYLM